RRQPLETANVEATEVDAARRLELAAQHARDDESRDDEEDVDTRKASRERKARVVQDDGEDGDRAQALDVEAPPTHLSTIGAPRDLLETLPQWCVARSASASPPPGRD